jgi:hypothetical protein
MVPYDINVTRCEKKTSFDFVGKILGEIHSVNPATPDPTPSDEDTYGRTSKIANVDMVLSYMRPKA